VIVLGWFLTSAWEVVHIIYMSKEASRTENFLIIKGLFGPHSTFR
jgi:hypothetical protein